MTQVEQPQGKLPVSFDLPEGSEPSDAELEQLVRNYLASKSKPAPKKTGARTKRDAPLEDAKVVPLTDGKSVKRSRSTKKLLPLTDGKKSDLPVETAPQSNPAVKKYGTKEEVWNGSAQITKGGLTKNDIMVSKKGKIISKKAHACGMNLISKLKGSAAEKK
jgi:hypothetical protein